MTIIRNIAKETFISHIDTKNWRFLIVNHNPSDEILIFLSYFDVCTVSNISLKEILTYPPNMLIKRPVKSKSKASTCSKCKGTGKRDWVEKVTGKSAITFDITTQYIRDQKYISNLFVPALSQRLWNFEPANKASTYGSFPLCNDGEEICPKCNGTGLFLLRESSILGLDETNRFIEYL